LSDYVFPGFPTFLESAANELNLSRSVGPARRIVALTDLANLCSQASLADRSHVEGILAKAVDFRDQLAIALRAAELMLAEVEAGLRVSTLFERESNAEPRMALPQSSRPARKGIRN
jgi:hypothetical protein